MNRVRPDLDAKMKEVDQVKVNIRMDKNLRLELMETLLEIQKLAGECFDMLDEEKMSQADVMLIMQLPDWCNRYTRGMEQHARDIVSRQKYRDGIMERARQRTSYMGTHGDFRSTRDV